MSSGQPPSSNGPAAGPALSLGVPGRPRRHGRWRRVSLVAAAIGLLAGWVAWYMATPEPLPVDDREVAATGTTRAPVYLGMFAAPEGFDRTLHVAGVKTSATASADVAVTPLLCRGGTIGVTSAPDHFCEELIDPAGATLGEGDSIVLEVSGEQALVAQVDRIRVAFREDLRWDTVPAGHAGATVVLGAG
ncbi:hypothetical protein E8D34_14655 [Nocardioides sp. GY 10113]|uniref:hypothetical protein n=1 Tax=Nocardioides sp. GY 10113 TaxID=2569761 RepID=UPI0010A8B639|nr:hypothetical protein [Nocardioides sp. GY 10113]TIC83808.1 hypothetical protein E8D34_14655 [Nocardioides sp. GY 10113]